MNTKQLIQKFWFGYASPKEKQQLLEQLEIKDHELKAELQEEFDQQPTLLSERLSPEQKKIVYDRLIKTIGDQSARKKQSLSRIIVKIAASLLLVAGGVSIIWKNQQDFVHTSVTVLPLQKRIVSSTSVFVRHILPDGTSVTLSPHSSLTYNPQFTDTSRMLSLTGKGKFDVTKDKHRPFTVISNGIATTALGTVFIIDGQNNKETNIHLVEGSIRVAPTAQSLHRFHETVLRAGEQIVINNMTQLLEWKISKKVKSPIKNTDPIPQHSVAVSLAATSSSLNFEKENLKTVFASIAKAKQVAIIYDGVNVNQLTFTGAFEASESIENILHILCGLNELEYRKEQSTYYVSKKAESSN